MNRRRESFGWLSIVAMGALLAATTGCDDGEAGVDADTSALKARETKLFVPTPDPAAVDQFFDLLKARRAQDAFRIAAMATTPQAVWLTGGTPAEVERSVKKTMRAAALTRTVPVLVAYNLPFRDCAQYSAGGATDTAAYKDWIDGFARGIGGDRAIVILEPDGLGIIPYNTTIYGARRLVPADGGRRRGNTVPRRARARPSATRSSTTRSTRSSPRRRARRSISTARTAPGWASARPPPGSCTAGVARRAHGFFLNVSNYQPTPSSRSSARGFPACITRRRPRVRRGRRATSTGARASTTRRETTRPSTTRRSSPATVTASIENMMGGAPATTRFVIDTSRNGQGPWTPTAA